MLSSTSSTGGRVGMWGSDGVQLHLQAFASCGMCLCRDTRWWSRVITERAQLGKCVSTSVSTVRKCVAISTTGDWMKRLLTGGSGDYSSRPHPDKPELLSEARLQRELRWHEYNYAKVGEVENKVFPFWRKKELDARSLTRKILELTKKKQLNQIFRLVERAKVEYYELNRITMNAVMQACVHCRDIDRALLVFEEMIHSDSCGVDTVTYGILIKGLGQAGRLDDAFQVFEAIEKGTAPGAPKLSDIHLNTLVNACADAGESLRARGILLRYRSSVDQTGPSAFTYNLLIKGYARSDNPLEALKVIDEMRENGLEPQQLTYNSLILACVRAGDTAKALEFFQQMKEDARHVPELLPDVVTYTTLIKGLAAHRDLTKVLEMVAEMKRTDTCILDRVAYTAIVDACIEAGSPIKGLEYMEELREMGKQNPQLRPRAHVFLALMRAFAEEGNAAMVESLRDRLLPEAAGFVWPEERAEADELLIEAAVAAGKLSLAKRVLRAMVGLKKGMPLSRRAYTAVVRLQALTGFNDDIFSPLRIKVSTSETVDRVMSTYAELKPAFEDQLVAEVVMRFRHIDVLPVVNRIGDCVGAVYTADCTELHARLGDVMRRCPVVVDATPVHKVVTTMLQPKSQLINVINSRTASYNRDGLLVGRTLGFLVPSNIFELGPGTSLKHIPAPSVDEED